MHDAEPQPALYTAAEVRALDRAAIDGAGIPGIVLMSRAGRAVFELACARYPGVLPMTTTDPARDDAASAMAALGTDIRAWARELGFPSLGICGTDLAPHDERLRQWVAQGLHGELDYMARHGARRWRPEELLPGTLRVISVRMDYHRADSAEPSGILNDAERAYVSRYALGRDYHKLMRARLARLADRILAARPGSAQRVFVDSAPVLERGVAQKAGLGWIGKNTLLIDPRAGSWFFLGEIYTDIPLPLDAEFSGMHCGSCTACLDVCPTAAFVSPFVLDARRCISYLTIELQGAIPQDLRPLIGNRVFGCDDCQLVCPWNKFAQPSCEADFAPRHGLDAARLTELFAWSAEQFAERAAGTPLAASRASSALSMLMISARAVSVARQSKARARYCLIMIIPLLIIKVGKSPTDPLNARKPRCAHRAGRVPYETDCRALQASRSAASGNPCQAKNSRQNRARTTSPWAPRSAPSAQSSTGRRADTGRFLQATRRGRRDRSLPCRIFDPAA